MCNAASMAMSCGTLVGKPGPGGRSGSKGGGKGKQFTAAAAATATISASADSTVFELTPVFDMASATTDEAGPCLSYTPGMAKASASG